MDITIKIDDDSRFKDIFENELDALTEKELHDIVVSVIAKYFEDEEHVKQLFYKEIKDNYGYKRTERTEFFNMLVPDTKDLTPEVEAVRARLKEVLSSDEMIKDLIKETWMENLSNNVTDKLINNYSMRNLISNTLLELKQTGQI